MSESNGRPAGPHAAGLAEHIASLESQLAEREGQLRALEAERNFYRKRWPPYAAKALLRRLWRAWKKLRQPAGDPQFGRDARTAVILLNEPDAARRPTLDALLTRQTRPATRIAAIAELPAAARDTDIVLLLHGDQYGAGPLWQPTLLEALAAAFASAPTLEAIILRGVAAGAPTPRAPRHLHDADVAQLATWPEQSLAVALRSTTAARLAETLQRKPVLLPPLRELAARPGAVMVASQFFSLDDATNAAGNAEFASRLPATPRAAARGLYITQFIDRGGADKGIVDLLSRVDHNLVDFSLLTTIGSDHPWESRVRPHVRALLHLAEALPLPAEPRYSDFIVEFVKRRQIGLVHIMHSFLGYDALPRLKRELPGVKVVDQCHILEPPHIMEGGHPAYSSRRYKQYFDHRTVTSQWLKNHLVRAHQVPERDISVIYTGVDATNEFAPGAIERGEFRTALGIDRDAFVVLFAGRLHPQKRPRLFLQTAQRFLDARPGANAQFVLVGGGEEYHHLRAAALGIGDGRRVIVVGPYDRMRSVYRDSDVLLMTSSHEGLAFVSFEAMAMALPQIFTDVNAQSELITPDTGVLIPPNDEARVVDAATAALLALHDDPARRSALGAAARQRVLDHFRIDQMVSAYEALYRRLLGVATPTSPAPSELSPT